MPTIAILDDEELLRQFLSAELMKVGYDVVAHENKDEFYELIPVLKPDLIISDLISPRIDGFQFLEMMQSKGIPIIIISGNIGRTPGYEEEAKRLGAVSCFKKPFEFDEVLAAIKRALSKD